MIDTWKNTQKRLQAIQEKQKDKDCEENVKEIEMAVDEMTRKYNSPEMIEKRKREYQKLCEEGEKRRLEFLKWEKERR